MNTAYLDPAETLKAIRPMEHVLGKSKIIAAANNFLFQFGSDGETIVNATDTETWMSAQLSQTQVQDSFELLLPGREIGRILANSAMPIEASSDGNVIRIIADGSKYQFGYVDPKTFPMAPDFDTDRLPVRHKAEVDAALLARAFTLVTPAASKGGQMGVAGVGLFHGGDFLMLASANDTRFATTRFACKWETGGLDPVNIVTIETAKAMASLDTKDPVVIESTDNLIRFAWGNNELICRVLARKFPPIKQFMPTKDHTQKFVAKAGAIAAALKKVQVVEADGDDSYADHGTLRFEAIDCLIDVTGTHGKAEATFPGTLSGDPFGATLRLTGVAWIAKSFDAGKDITFYRLNEKDFISVTCDQTVFTIPPRYKRKEGEA